MALLLLVTLPFLYGCVPEASQPVPEAPAAAADSDSGRFRPARSPNDEEGARLIEELEAIGYLQGSVAEERGGVTILDRDLAQAGRSFLTSGHGPEALLIDIEGNVLHSWRASFQKIWPDRSPGDNVNASYWRRAYVTENGDVFAIFEGLGLVKVNRQSEVIWQNPANFHHDLVLLPDGGTYALDREAHLDGRYHDEKPILEDFFVELSPEGRVVERFSLLDAIERSPYRHQLGSFRDHGDLLHTNSLELIPENSAIPHEAFRPGNVIVAMNAITTLAVLDLDTQEIVFAHRFDFKGVHDPSVLNDGGILLFENRAKGKASRAAVWNVANMSTNWTYGLRVEEPLFSRHCGAASRQANGNVLVTESDRGRAIEITPGGEIVWEFFNPYRAGSDLELIATLFEVIRLPPDFGDAWIQRSPEVK